MPEPGRAQQRFPSRQYSHGSSRRAGFAAAPSIAAGRAYRFVLGRDASPQPLDANAPGAPRDPLAALVLFAGRPLPLTLRSLLARMDGGANALPVQCSFIVADGGQIPWSPDTDALQRNFRLVVTRHAAEGRNPDLLVSASTDLDSEAAFLQVIGWDETAGAFQFYDRREGSWIWAGSSWDALAPGSRGHGPFDSHVNGALNMKELKRPWVHWHSQAAQIPDSALAPDDPLAAEALWTKRSQAEEFERAIARPGIQRWTAARLARRTQGGVLMSLPEFMRQVLETSTINLAASPTSFPALAAAAKIQLPLTFFINTDAIVDVLDLDPGIGVPSIAAAVYRDALKRFHVAITDGRFRFDGDTHFLFVVPEPAYEDVLILQRLVEIGVLSRKLAACLLMVDFANPVFSRRRAALMRHVPVEAPIGEAAAFDDVFLTTVRAAVDAGTAGPAEAELLANWETPDPWPAAFEARIRTFMNAVIAALDEPDRFARVFELAESRRREFRKRPLAEFRLTTPVTSIPDDAPLLEFAEDGSVREKRSSGEAT